MSRTLKASLLFFFFVVCAAAFVLEHKMRERLPAPAPRDLFAAVNDQLAAFRVADFQGAYRHAASGVQQKFTLTQFEKMMRQSHPEMMRVRRVEFGSVEVSGTSAVVQVFVFGPGETVRSFFYSLINEDDAWRIDGVKEQTLAPRSTLTGTQA